MSKQTATQPQTLIVSFEIETGQGNFAFDAHVDAQALAGVVKTPKDLQKFGAQLCEKFGVDERDGYDRPRFKGLPFTARGVGGNHPFEGRWIAGSPVGMENTTPPPAWNFADRLALVNDQPDTYPLIQGEIAVKNCKTQKIAKDLITAALEDVLGAVVVKNIDAHKISSPFDNLFGDYDGATC